MPRAATAGRLQMHILGAIAEFERARIAERVKLGLARVRAQGRRLGRPRMDVTEDQLRSVTGLSIRRAASQLGVSPSTIYRRLAAAKLREQQPQANSNTAAFIESSDVPR